MHTPLASNENGPVPRDGITSDDLLALTDRFGQLLAMARRINESGTPEERFIVETAMRRAGFTLEHLQRVVDAWTTIHSHALPRQP